MLSSLFCYALSMLIVFLISHPKAEIIKVSAAGVEVLKMLPFSVFPVSCCQLEYNIRNLKCNLLNQ